MGNRRASPPTRSGASRKQVIEEAEALLPIAHKSGIPERDELLDELRKSLEARCESCCRGIEHDDERCGAPTTRRLLVAAGRMKTGKGLAGGERVASK